jgi:small acid-soluble spore protein D (minor alpha/beta-type SASP)
MKTVLQINNTYTELILSLYKYYKEWNKMANSSNKLLVPGIEQYLDQVKYEIAQEFGVQLGSDTVSRENGSVGGEITKRLVQQAQAQISGQFTKQ